MQNLILITSKLFASSSVKVDGNTYITNLPTVNANNGSLTSILQIVFGIIGSVAVIIIMVAALQFVTSGGNPESAKRARETIIFAVIGLIIVISAEFIVTFALGKL